MLGVGGIAQRGPLVEKDCLSSSSPEPLSTLFRLLFSFVVKPGKMRGKVTGWAENTLKDNQVVGALFSSCLSFSFS